MDINKHPETLIVCRDGQLDAEYYDAIYAQRRQEALQRAGRQLVHHLLHLPVYLGRGVLAVVETME